MYVASLKPESLNVKTGGPESTHRIWDVREALNSKWDGHISRRD